MCWRRYPIALLAVERRSLYRRRLGIALSERFQPGRDLRREFVEGLGVQVAMWADDLRFGHGLNDDDYEDDCQRFTDEIYDTIYETLRSRPIR